MSPGDLVEDEDGDKVEHGCEEGRRRRRIRSDIVAQRRLYRQAEDNDADHSKDDDTHLQSLYMPKDEV